MDYKDLMTNLKEAINYNSVLGGKLQYYVDTLGNLDVVFFETVKYKEILRNAPGTSMPTKIVADLLAFSVDIYATSDEVGVSGEQIDNFLSRSVLNFLANEHKTIILNRIEKFEKNTANKDYKTKMVVEQLLTDIKMNLKKPKLSDYISVNFYNEIFKGLMDNKYLRVLASHNTQLIHTMSSQGLRKGRNYNNESEITFSNWR